MFSIIKSGFMLPFIVLFFSSCYTTTLYNHTRYQENIAGNQPLNSKDVFRNDIPACALRQLLKRFPAAENINWQKETKGGWLASFTTGKIETSINFDDNGDWQRIYSRYFAAPTEVRDAVAKAFNGYRITSVYSVVVPADELHADFNVVVRNQTNCKVLELYNGNLSVFTDLGHMP